MKRDVVRGSKWLSRTMRMVDLANQFYEVDEIAKYMNIEGGWTRPGGSDITPKLVYASLYSWKFNHGGSVREDIRATRDGKICFAKIRKHREKPASVSIGYSSTDSRLIYIASVLMVVAMWANYGGRMWKDVWLLIFCAYMLVVGVVYASARVRSREEAVR